jgi:hypothetical protein
MARQLRNLQPFLPTAGVYYKPALSPDDRRLAFDLGSSKGTGIAVYDPTSSAYVGAYRIPWEPAFSFHFGEW